MTNIVKCKICGADFNYVPGYSGNARQYCVSCKAVEDEKELRELEEKTITEGNKYLAGNVYDMVDILVDGNIPTFANDGEKFICATEVGKFIRSAGFSGIEENFCKLCDALGLVHFMVLSRTLAPNVLESLVKNEKLKPIQRFIKDIDKLVWG